MKQAARSFRGLCQLLVVLAIGVVGLQASTLNCNSTSSGVTGTAVAGNTVTCNIFIDIFNPASVSYTGTGLSGTPLSSSTATLEPAGTSASITIPGWNESTGIPTLAMELQSVSLTLNWAGAATVTVQNTNSSALDFTNALASVPMSISGPTNVGPVTITSTGVNSQHYPSGNTDTPVPGAHSTTTTDNFLGAGTATQGAEAYLDAYAPTTTYVNCVGLSVYACQLAIEDEKEWEDLCTICDGYYGDGSEPTVDHAISSGSKTELLITRAIGDTSTDCSTLSGTFSDTLGSAVSETYPGGPLPHTYTPPATISCSGIPAGTVNGQASYNSVRNTGTTGPTSGNPNAYEANNSTPSLSFEATAGNAQFQGTEVGGNGSLFFGGSGTIGGILEVTYVAEATTVPEPITLFLVGGALIGTGLLRRRKVRRP